MVTSVAYWATRRARSVRRDLALGLSRLFEPVESNLTCTAPNMPSEPLTGRTPASRIARRRLGRTVLEFSVVIVAITAVTAIAGPTYVESLERDKVDRACRYLASIQEAQTRFCAEHGRYADSVDRLDLDQPQPAHFTVAIDQSAADVGDPGQANSDAVLPDPGHWTATLTRTGANQMFGPYTISYDAAGFTSRRSSVPRSLLPERMDRDTDLDRPWSWPSDNELALR